MYKIYTKNYYRPLSRLLTTIFMTVGGVLRLNKSFKRQLIMGMNITSVLLIVTMMQVSAAGFAQKITFVQKDASLQQLFKVIKKQAGYDVLWPSKSIKTAKTFDASFNNADLKEVLNKTFENQSFEYVIEDKVIVIKEKDKSLLDRIIDRFNQIDVTGKVIDENGRPLVKATVRSKKGNRMTFTDAYGDFKLANVDENDLLMISFLGYEQKEVPAAKNMGSIQLQESAGKLDEVVISNGYQDVKKAMMTGSLARVKAEDLVINGTNTIEQLLQGKLAGMQVINNSGMVGTKQTVRVRGTSTLLGNQEPVWVVDGIIQEDPLPFKATELNNWNTGASTSDGLKQFIGSAISWLNPYDIEDVTVLKDAASTAIYGVKAANGVILINTKRGKPGSTPQISYNNSFSFENKLSYDQLNLMNSQQRIDVSREIYERGLLSNKNSWDNIGYQGLLNQYLTNKLPYEDFNAGVKQLELNNTDWLDLLFQTPLSQNHNISIGGGGPTNSYYGSFGYNNKVGQAKGNSQDSYNGNVNFTSIVNSKLTVGVRLSGAYATTNGFYDLDATPYAYATKTNRAIPAFNPDGSLAYYMKGNGVFKYNYLNEQAHTGNYNYKSNLNSAINIKYQLPLGFRFESTLGLGYTNTHGEAYADQFTNLITYKRGYEYGDFGPATTEYKASILPNGGVLDQLESRNLNYTFRNGLSYQKTIAKKHFVSGMVGFEMRSNQYAGSSNKAYGYLPDRGKVFLNPPATYINSTFGTLAENPIYTTETLNTLTDRKANYVAYYLTGAYSYDSKYVFNMSIRGDASNRFGQDTRSRFSPVWAIGAKWNVARESWFERTEWFNDFSIRATYGYQGNVAENYGPDLVARMPSANDGINSMTGEPILKISTLPYTDLRMEKTQTVNLGFDLSFFSNRISASVDYYNKKSKDLIVLKDVPYEYGVLQMPVNSGDLENSGLDVAINFVPVRNKNLTWTVSLNSGYNHNKVTSKLLPNGTWFNAVSGSYNVAGYPVSSFWIFDYTGLNAAGRPTFNLPVNAESREDATGYMIYGGKLNADFTGGFSTSVRYKQFTVSTNLYVSLGGKKILPNLYTPDIANNTPNEFTNLSAELVNRWRKPGDELIAGMLPGIPSNYTGPGASVFVPGEVTPYSPYTFYNYTASRVVNASFLRMNNINVNYSLPDHISKRFLSKNTTFGYSLSNPFTMVSKDYKGIDPEVASGGQPLPRTHVFSLSVTF